jgi:hypothetical protein
VSEEEIMSLPACQQRALNAMEHALVASEPRLATSFAPGGG